MADGGSTGAPSMFDQVRRLVAERVPVVVGTIVRGAPIGAKMLVAGDEIRGSLGDPELDDAFREAAMNALAAERSEVRTFRTAAGSDVDVFVDAYPPPPQLIIFGAVHVAQPLARYARDLGYLVTVVDARRTLATRERFPDVERLIVAWPDDAFADLDIHPSTAIAILTHDPKFDEPALLGALRTPARYIGAVGSRSTNADRRERLIRNGVSADDLERVHGPIGLDIGGQTPEEMAISILGEIIATRYGRSGGALTSARGSIRGEVA
ncbi:MAG TPA: XdhC/CoxI family protein [Thermomicrobiales bacterium]|nr:XdhC/CoxI family protein [Thermomicrobiales bacterium]